LISCRGLSHCLTIQQQKNAQAIAQAAGQQGQDEDDKDVGKQRATRTNAATGHPTPQASVKPQVVGGSRKRVVERGVMDTPGTMDTSRGLSGSDRMLRSASKGAQATNPGFGAPSGYRVNKREDSNGGPQQWY
jgi:casein kinase I family protein HRR25